MKMNVKKNLDVILNTAKKASDLTKENFFAIICSCAPIGIANKSNKVLECNCCPEYVKLVEECLCNIDILEFDFICGRHELYISILTTALQHFSIDLVKVIYQSYLNIQDDFFTYENYCYLLESPYLKRTNIAKSHIGKGLSKFLTKLLDTDKDEIILNYGSGVGDANLPLINHCKSILSYDSELMNLIAQNLFIGIDKITTTDNIVDVVENYEIDLKSVLITHPIDMCNRHDMQSNELQNYYQLNSAKEIPQIKSSEVIKEYNSLTDLFARKLIMAYPSSYLNRKNNDDFSKYKKKLIDSKYLKRIICIPSTLLSRKIVYLELDKKNNRDYLEIIDLREDLTLFEAKNKFVDIKEGVSESLATEILNSNYKNTRKLKYKEISENDYIISINKLIMNRKDVDVFDIVFDLQANRIKIDQSTSKIESMVLEMRGDENVQ